MISSRLEARKKDFKGAIDIDASRKSRMTTVANVRKSQKEEMLNKRRQLSTICSTGMEDPMVAAAAEIVSDGRFDARSVVARLNSTDLQTVLEAAAFIRQVLSVESNPPIDEVVMAGAVPKLVQLLRAGNSKLTLEVSWALTNIASGESEHTKAVVDAGGIQVLLPLLYNEEVPIVDQAVWALGNIAGDCVKYRDEITMSGAINRLVEIADNAPTNAIRRNAVWALSNLCRGRPTPQPAVTAAIVPLLVRMLECNDESVVVDALWGLSYISDADIDRITQVLKAGCGPRIIQMMIHPSPSIQTPALRVTGNIATGNEEQTQYMVDNGVLNALSRLMSTNRKVQIRKEICWTISNIAAGTPKQVQSVIDAGLIQLLVDAMNTGNYDVRREATWAMANAASSGNEAQIRYIVDCDSLKPFCDQLSSDDNKLVGVVLETLDNVLKSAKGPFQNQYIQTIQEAGGADKLEDLMAHRNGLISNRAETLYNKWFQDMADENNMPNVFSFGQKTLSNTNNNPTSQFSF